MKIGVDNEGEFMNRAIEIRFLCFHLVKEIVDSSGQIVTLVGRSSCTLERVKSLKLLIGIESSVEL